MKKFLSLSLIAISLFLVTTVSVKAMTVWKFEDWQDGTNYGSKTKTTDNITNLKGEKEEQGGMKRGPFNKASKAKLSDGIKEEVYVGLKKDDYKNGELFELSIAINQQNGDAEEYLTEAVVMTQKSGDNFILTSTWAKDKNPIATIDEDGVYTYKWEFRKGDNDKIQVKFTILNYGNVVGTTGFVDLDVANASKATTVRYLWACNIKASYGVDIYTKLPPKPDSTIENPETADINVFFFLGMIGISSLGLFILKKDTINN